MYDENKDCIGEVNLAGIHQVETSLEPRCAKGCGFDVSAHVNKGGDARGMRTFIFEAKTPELSRQWMEEICKASGKFVLKSSPQGGFHSEREGDRSAMKNAWLLTGTQTGGAAVAEETSGDVGVPAGPAGAERRRSVLLDARGGRGGGRGRGEAFAAGSSRRASVKIAAPLDFGAPIDFGPDANKGDLLQGASRRGSRRGSAGGGRGFEKRVIAPGNI